MWLKLFVGKLAPKCAVIKKFVFLKYALPANHQLDNMGDLDAME